MENLQVFNYQNNQVRTVNKESEIWFVLKDVCKVLEIKNSRDVLTRLDEDEKGVDLIDTLGGKQNMAVVNEPGLYSVVLRSDKPQAKKFKRWVTHDVIPTIRKTGSYSIGVPQTYKEALLELVAKVEENEQLQLINAQQNQVINELQPKATYYDLILQNKSLFTITQIAKDYGISGVRLNNILKELKIQYKQSEQWFLYQKYADKGYTQSKTHDYDGGTKSKLHTCWTQKGRLFLYDLLKNNEVLPLIEIDSD